MSASAESQSTLETALRNAAGFLPADPPKAIEQVHEILHVMPGQPNALLLGGVAHRLQGETQQSLAWLEPLARAHPTWAAAHFEYGLALGGAGDVPGAVSALRRAVALQPESADACRALGDHLMAIGDRAGADFAYAQQIKASTRDPRLLRAADALVDNRIPEAETLLRSHLLQFPTDVAAIRMFAEVAVRLGRYADAEHLLARCLELAPSFTAARHHYAIVLYRQNKGAKPLREIEQLLARDPRNPGYLNLKAAILSQIGDYAESLETYADVLAQFPGNAKVWMSYGHSLKTAGRVAESIEAYRRSIALLPRNGEAYWSLANLKTFRFEPADVQAMQSQLSREALSAEERFHFHFAMGKALEDAGDYAPSFEHYAQGNRLRRATLQYSADEISRNVRRAKAIYTREFFAARTGFGHAAPDPIFVVGLPRSGSTLIEQMLSSHSAVEGTMELPDVRAIARALNRPTAKAPNLTYLDTLPTLSAEEFAALGVQYLQQTQVQRHRGTPYFIDKMPNNFPYVGLIHLMLPRAKIIDARRHPVGCCFSGFKQHFALGQGFTYSLEDLGRYYRDYVELMAHFDAVLPGRVHRVYYEDMVEDTEAEVRRLLAYCELPFETGCLRFYQNERAVRTASSEQVRQPIFRDGVERWKQYEPWLEPLKLALGTVLETYPKVPSEFLA